MRICIITNFFPPITIGGAEMVCHQTALGLKKAGHEVYVIVGHPHITKKDAPQKDYEIDGINVHRIYPKIPFNFLPMSYNQLFNNSVEKLINPLVRALNPDIIHYHNISGLTLSAIRGGRTADKPSVMTLHDYWMLCPNNMLFTNNTSPCNNFVGKIYCHNCFHKYDFWGNVPFRQRIIKKEVERDIDRFIAPSRFMADRLVEGGYDENVIRVIYHGMDIDTYRKNIRPLSEIVSEMCSVAINPAVALEILESSDFLVQFAGHLTIHKGGEYLIKALHQLHKDGEKFTLAITGSAHPHELSRLKDMVNKFDIKDNVIFLGKIPSSLLPSLYARADAVIVPSIWYENASVVVAEAMIAGTPVIASDIGGNPEFVKDGYNGFTFKPKDESDLALKIRTLMNDKPLINTLRKNARIRADQLFNMDRHVKLIMSCYEESIAAHLRG
ncbi:glycosyltransferase family 4 protein [Methanocella conradii]|uniref:glycosyltransferase family 4 protein n=1 Tax=Methanocella conradii TaxID=1175444 RepID=UPI0020C6B8E2|nr:glycosyltransferase family 4 protein [Methanocella conradii]